MELEKIVSLVEKQSNTVPESIYEEEIQEIRQRAEALKVGFTALSEDVLSEAHIRHYFSREGVWIAVVDLPAPARLSEAVNPDEDEKVFMKLCLAVRDMPYNYGGPQVNLLTQVLTRDATDRLHLAPAAEFLERPSVYDESDLFSTMLGTKERMRVYESELSTPERLASLSAGLDLLEQRLAEVSGLAGDESGAYGD